MIHDGIPNGAGFYIRHNVRRTDSPTYLKNGWPIGSGVIKVGL